MHEIIRTVLIYVAVLAMIIGGFYLYKDNRYKVTVEPTDRSMTPEYVAGGYNVISGQIQVNDAVVFSPPDKPDEWRIARVVALGGQKVEVDEKGVVKVDGAAHKLTCETTLRPFQIKVPAASAFLLCDQPGSLDSSKLGPIPLYQIVGKLKPAS